MCRMELVPAAVADGAAPADAGDERVLAIDPVVVQNASVRIDRVRRGPLTQDLRLAGTLQVAQDRQRDVTLKFSGFVEVLHANRDGMAIRRGDPLFEIYSPDLIVAEERLIAAHKSGEPVPLLAARLRLERWDVASATMDALIATGTVPRTVVWPSPFDGLLVSAQVVQGGRIDAGTTALRIADLSTVWLEAQVPESQLPWVRRGMTAAVELPSQPGTTLHGTVSLVAPVVDERTRSGALRIELANPEGNLLPGMFARVRLQAVQRASALLLPDEAILETGERQLCWVALGEGRFAPRTLRLGAAGDGGVTEVLDGLAEGEPVVVSGQLLIEADSRLREGLRKFGRDDLLPTGEVPAAAAPPLAPATRQIVDRMFASYLTLGRALSSDRDDATAWSDFAAAVRELPADASEGVAALQAVVATEAADLVTRRELYLRTSAALIALTTRLRPSDALGAELLVVHCSMKPGSWLQTERAVRNPFYGAEMLACGAIERVLPTAAGGGR